MANTCPSSDTSLHARLLEEEFLSQVTLLEYLQFFSTVCDCQSDGRKLQRCNTAAVELKVKQVNRACRLSKVC